MSVLLVIGFVAYSIHEKRLLEEYERSDRKPGNGTVIATYGKIPEFENEEQRRDWLNNLSEIGKGVRSEMRPYFYPEGSVVGYGHHYDGYMSISFEKDMVVEKPLMDEIYEIFDRRAREIGIQEVPLVFEFGEIPVETE